MTFLNLWATWIAAAVIPALLILYFLKLRRREQTVASTLLWKRAIQDLQVNAPFQRLRKNLLLLLQLLILAAGIVALARPIIETTATREGRVVVLIDRSASMNAREADGRTRLELAKEQAVRLVKSLNRTGSTWLSLTGAKLQSEAMVIAFADRALPLCSFTANTGELVDLINAIEPSDAQTNLAEALRLAQADMTPLVMTSARMEEAVNQLQQTPVSATPPAKLILVSDGCVGELDDVTLKGGALELINVGTVRDNVGITALRTQRSYEEPEKLSVFVHVQNLGDQPVVTDVAVYVDGVLAGARPVSLGPAAARGAAPASGPSGSAPAEVASAQLAFELPLDRAAVLEARLARADPLAVDNTAWAVVPPPRKLRVLVVTKGNFFLDSIMRGLPLAEYPFVTPEQYEAGESTYEDSGQSTFNLVIFDKYSPKRLPMGNFIFFGALPPLEQVKARKETDGHNLIWWDETHPILRYCDEALSYVTFAHSTALSLPDDAERLIEGPDGPILARYSSDGRHCLIASFAIEQTDWWKRGFPVFAYNAIRYMGGGASFDDRPLRPGASLRFNLPPDKKETIVHRPDARTVAIKADNAGAAYYRGADRVGVYRADPAVPGWDRYAVNLEDDRESDIAPRSDFRVGGKSVEVGKRIEQVTPEVWRWFVGVALAIMLLEWYIYNRRVMI